MSNKFERIPYTVAISLTSGSSFNFEENTSLECRIEKANDPTWNAEVMYNASLTPTVVTYETTGIETSDIASKFCIFNNSNLLTLKNNEGSTIDLLITRKA